MSRKIAMVLALLLALGLASACSGSAAPESAAPQTAPEGSAAQTLPEQAAPAQAQPEEENPPVHAPEPEVYTLTVHNHDSEKNASGRMLAAWAKDVESASGGLIDVVVYNNGVLGPPSATLDLLDSGSVDAAWGVMSFYEDEFLNSQVISLPMLGIKNAAQGSNVLWELYEDYDYIDSDFDRWKVLYLHTNSNTPLISTFRVDSVSDFQGKNIRAISGPVRDFFERLGSAPVSTGLLEIYTCLENGTIDGSVQGWDVVQTFNIYEVADYFLDEELACYGCFLLMNKDSYAALPAELQAVIDQCSGDYFLQYSDYLWDELEGLARAAVTENGGECYKLSDAAREHCRGVANNVLADWCANTDYGWEMYYFTKELVEKYGYFGA